jgi:hypothetical protein
VTAEKKREELRYLPVHEKNMISFRKLECEREGELLSVQ